MSTWITLSVIALAPMILRAPKALAPLRVNAVEPSRFSGLFRRYAIHTFTGYASDVGKRSDSYTKGSVSTSAGAGGNPGTVTTAVDTEVVVTDRFFLTDREGQVISFEGTGFEALVGNGHLVSLAWVIHGRRKSGPHFLIYDHVTSDAFFNDKAIRKAITFPYPTLYVALLCLMILPFPVLIFFGIADLWQVARFRRRGVKPLLGALESAVGGLSVRAGSPAAAVPVPHNNGVAALKDLAALRRSGDLSLEEYEAAKARLLEPGAQPKP